jgi:protein Mpv17
MKNFRNWYDKWLTKAPLLTKGITSAVIYGLGDRIAQKMEQQKHPQQQEEHQVTNWNKSLQRTARMMFWGGFALAPLTHHWLNFLDRSVKGTGKLLIAKKIALDQLIYTPPLFTAFYLTTQFLEGDKDRRAIMDGTMARLPQTLVVNWMVWPVIQVATFGFVPLPYRLLFINCMGLGWSIFMSSMSSEEEEENLLKKKKKQVEQQL